MARFGILTGGGDCPGLNAVIRGVVRAGVNRHGHQIIGFRYGWAGVLEANTVELTAQNTAGILHRGGTILGTSRTNPYKGDADGTALVREALEREGIDALIPIGGEDTLGVAGRLSADGVPVVGVPKTIDNDLAGTDVTFGFHTAVQIATDAIDRLHTTAESHNRVIILEVMGRHAGWIAAYSGIAGGADVILVPERPFDIDEVCERIKRRHARGTHVLDRRRLRGRRRRATAAGITTAGAKTDAFGHARLGGIAVELEREIEERTGLRDAHDDPRPRPARRHADRLRPRAGHALRRQGRRGGRPRRVGDDGLAARHRHRPGRRWPTRSPSPSSSTTISTTPPRCSSGSDPPDRVPDRLATLAGCAACRRCSSSPPSRCVAVRLRHATPRPPTTTSTRSTGPRPGSPPKFDRLSSQITSTSTAAQDRQTLDGFRQAIDKVVTDFRAVKAPDKVKALHDRLIAEISAYGKEIDKAKAAFADNDPAGDRQGAGRSRQRGDQGAGADQRRRSRTSTRSCASNYAGPMLEGLMQNDFQLTVGAMRRRLRSCYPEPGGGHARGRRAGTRLLRRGGRARRPPRARARAPRRGARRARRDLRLELPAPLRALHGGALLRRGAAHAEHPPVPRAGRLHRQPRRGRRRLRRRLAGRAAGRARAAAARTCASTWSWATATSTRCRAPSPTSSCSRRPARASTPGPRSTSAPRRRSATRAAPPATRRACSTRTARCRCTRRRSARPTRSGSRRATACWPSCRCSTSTRGACPSPRR